MTQSAHKTSIKLIAPSGVDLFACTGCGGCCKLWGVSIDPFSFERARAFLENPPSPRPNAELPWYIEEDGQKYYQLTESGRCVFLEKDNKCYLHKHDPMLKSVVCRDFPRGGMMTPRGYEVYMSFSSPGAFLNVLTRPEPFTLVQADMPPPPENIHVPACPIRAPRDYSWDTYFLIEEILLDFIGRMNSLDDALIASARFLAAVEQEEDGKKLRRRLRDRTLHPLVFMEQKPVSNLEGAYRMLEQILSLRIQFLKKSPILRSCVEELQQMVDDLRRGPEEEKVGRALFYRRLRRTFYDPSQAALEPVIRKFLLHKIFQKAVFFEHGLFHGINIICFFYAILRFRLMIRARNPSFAKASEGGVAVSDLFDPIHFVEVHFAHSGKFLQFWKDVIQTNLLANASLSEIMVRA